MTPEEENILLAMEVARLEEALITYWNEDNWLGPWDSEKMEYREGRIEWCNELFPDGAEIARTALATPTPPTKAQAMLKVANAAVGYINAKGYTNIKPKLEELQQAVKELEEIDGQVSA